MPILTVFLVLIVAGVLLWAVTTYIPMAPPIKSVIIGLALVLQVFGVLDSLGSVTVGRHR